MRLPDATDQIRLAPVRALRAVFSGVGQLLLATDRLREDDARAAQEPGEHQPGTRASWDGRLSSSVRLISPSGMPVEGSGSARGATPEPARRKPSPAGRRSGTRGRKAEAAGRRAERAAGGKIDRASTGRTGGQPKQAGQSGRSAAGRAQPADAKRVTGAKAANAGSGRRSARGKHAAEPSRFRSLDLTGNVRMLSGQDVADLASDRVDRSTADALPLPPSAADLAEGTGTPSWSDAALSWSSLSAGTASSPELSPPLDELPISGYDDLSLPSLRARLRSLGTAELRYLLAHERSHANREDVVTMFERRIAKLADGT